LSPAAAANGGHRQPQPQPQQPPPQQQPQQQQPQQQHPAMTPQGSSLSQPSQTSLAPAPRTAPAIQVKLHYNADLIAIRVPQDITFYQLYDRVCDRLRVGHGDSVQLSFKDEPTGDKINLMSDGDLDFALRRNNEKLLLYVDVV